MLSVAGDTQVLDADPSVSDCETDDGCGGGGGGEIPILYGETQALDDADDALVGRRDGGVKGCGETQLVDTCADETSERTEVLSEGEEPSSCAGTSCDACSGGGGDALGRADGGDLALEKEDDSVDSDISTDDDDEDVGLRKRRSFTDIRAKAVRSSGLAASRHAASKKFNSDVHSKKTGNSEAGGTDATSFGLNHWADKKKYPTSLYSEIGELHLEHGMENSFGSSENHYNLEDKNNKSSNKRVKKLFDDAYLEKNESESKDDDTAEQKDMPHLHATDNIAGLSYVTSQEPGHQSQVNALDLVDKFLLTNDVGSSQELKNGKSDIYKCAPVSSSKLLGCLAEKNVCRSSIGTPSIFDWDDNLEDEGGGDFFWKRKDSLLEGTSVAQKTKSHPPKIWSSITGRSITVFENSQAVKDGTKNNCNRSAVLAHSDSRLVIQKSTNIHHISQIKAKKSLFMDMDEESNSKDLEHNLEMADAAVVYNTGPDTQMAAEAMEALCNVSAVNSDKDRHLTPGISMQKNNGLVKKRGPSENDLPQKWSPIADQSDAEGIRTRSKRRIHATKERKRSFSLHRDLSINSRMKSQEHRNSKVKTGMEKLKLHDQLTIESSRRCAASDSSKNKKGQKRMDKRSSKSVDTFLDQQNGHSFLSEGLKIGDHDDDSAPVAHRTRHSKRAKLLEDAESLSKDVGPDVNRLIDTKKEGNVIVDASVPKETGRGCSNVDPRLDSEVRMCSSSHSGVPNSGTTLEESKVSLLEEALVDHPKRKRSTRQILRNQLFKGNGNKPNVLVSNTEKMDKHTKREINKVYIRSVSEILVKPKQKTRIVSTQMLLENAALFSDSNLVQTKSLQKSPLFKAHSQISKCLSRSVSNQASLVEPVILCSNGLNEHVGEAEELSTHKSGDEDTEHAEENAKLEGLSRHKIQSPNLAYATPSKGKHVLSPVCAAEDLPKSFKKSSATPVIRELLRLEASTTPLHKDVRRRKDMASVRVLFSHHLDEDIVKQQKKILTRLGLAIASSISDATHFVTDKFVRTQNMLEAIAVGKPVVTPMWLESCGQASCFLDERNYILRDIKKEKELGFNMQVSLARACQCPVLLGKTVYMTPNVKPSMQALSSIVKAASGKVIARIGRSMMKQAGVPADLLIISCVEDYSLCIPMLEKGAQIFSSELLLNGIVIQKLEFRRHQLFLDHVKSTRSTLWLRDKDGGQFLPVNRCT